MWVSLLVAVEISFVSVLHLLLFSDFLYFVVVDVELLSIVGAIVELLSCSGGRVGLLKANKGVDCSFLFVLEDLHLLKVSVGLEKLLQVLLGGIRGEVLDIEVAPLLGVLVPEHLLLLLELSVLRLQSLLGIDLASINFLVMHVLASLESGICSVLLVQWVFGVLEADEGEGSFIVFQDFQTLNVTELSKDFFYSLLSHLVIFDVLRKILHVDVVETSSVVSDISGLVGNDGLLLTFHEDWLSILLDLDLSKMSVQDFCGRFGRGKGDEAISFGGVVNVLRDLQGLDFTSKFSEEVI